MEELSELKEHIGTYPGSLPTQNLTQKNII